MFPNAFIIRLQLAVFEKLAFLAQLGPRMPDRKQGVLFFNPAD